MEVKMTHSNKLKFVVSCLCGWIGEKRQLEHDSDIELMHPANKGKVFLDGTGMDTAHVTEALKCPRCGRWIYADDKPTGVAKSIEMEDA